MTKQRFSIWLFWLIQIWIKFFKNLFFRLFCDDMIILKLQNSSSKPPSSTFLLIHHFNQSCNLQADKYVKYYIINRIFLSWICGILYADKSTRVVHAWVLIRMIFSNCQIAHDNLKIWGLFGRLGRSGDLLRPSYFATEIVRWFRLILTTDLVKNVPPFFVIVICKVVITVWAKVMTS